VCGHCRNFRAGRRHLCKFTSSIGVNRDGAFAEFVVIPEQNVWRHPLGIDPESVRAHIMEMDHVTDVHDLHITRISSDLPVLTAHVIVDDSCFRDGHVTGRL
jgi:hypothetical protein